jgi:hypothetical protein
VDVSSEAYFAALNDLSGQALIERKRGQGGQISLAVQSIATPEQIGSPPTLHWDEPRLMPCLEKYLRTMMWRELDLPRGNGEEWLVINTSMSGPRKGKWTRPDYTVLSIMAFTVLPWPQLDVYSFELKALPSCNLTSVHEALAQTRMTNYGYLVWHLPHGSSREVEVEEMVEECSRHGIGLILICEPDDPESWAIKLFAHRKNTDLAEIEIRRQPLPIFLLVTPY